MRSKLFRECANLYSLNTKCDDVIHDGRAAWVQNTLGSENRTGGNKCGEIARVTRQRKGTKTNRFGQTRVLKKSSTIFSRERDAISWLPSSFRNRVHARASPGAPYLHTNTIPRISQFHRGRTMHAWFEFSLAVKLSWKRWFSLSGLKTPRKKPLEKNWIACPMRGLSYSGVAGFPQSIKWLLRDALSLTIHAEPPSPPFSPLARPYLSWPFSLLLGAGKSKVDTSLSLSLSLLQEVSWGLGTHETNIHLV